MSAVKSTKSMEMADLCGITSKYQDWANNTVQVPDEHYIPILKAMGIDVSSDKNINKEIQKHYANEWGCMLPPVQVVHEEKVFSIPICVLAKRTKGQCKGVIELESGQLKLLEIQLDALQVIDVKKLNNKEMVKLNLILPSDLPQGYHKLSLKYRDQSAYCQLVVVPSNCYEPEILSKGSKLWGSSIQLYSVRTHENWGIGDFSDLKKIVTMLGSQGADVVGLSPIHSLYPANPQHCSPYSPSSRKYINPLYIDVTAVDDFNVCKSVRQKIDSEDFNQRLHAAKSAEYVDYGLVASLKFSVLELLFENFNKHHGLAKTARWKAFNKFCKIRGKKLEQHALYEAIFQYFKAQDSTSWGWTCWPEAYQNPNNKEVKAFGRKHKDRVLYFTWLQWLAEEQLEAAQQAAIEAKMSVGIYRDLAVGVDREGSDVWNDCSYYCLDASVGAPPDGLAPQGQNWGLPPFNPVALYNGRYAPFIEMVRANMQHCGALRIDHVMGLLRLWWCPIGKTSEYGVYVNYSLDDMLGIIKLESQRHKCLVFGEDLGTVPDEVRDKLTSSVCYSNEVVLFSRKNDRFMSPEDYKSRALACIANHDTPTLKAWWNCSDLDLRESLAIYDHERTQREKIARHDDKIALLKTLKEQDELPWYVDPDDIDTMAYTYDIMGKIHYYLAKTDSKIIVIQLEDMLELETPVNVPGTSIEYPNWRRRLSMDVTDLINMPISQSLLKNISLIRKS